MVNPLYRPGCLRWSALPIALWGLVQLGAGLATLQTPPEVGNRLPVMLLGCIALLWAVWAAGLAVGLLWARTTAAVASVWSLLAWAFYQMLRYLFLTRADYEGARLPFLLTVNLLLVGMALTILGWHYTHRSNPNGE